MKLSTSVLYAILASTAMSASDVSASYTPPTSTAVSVPSSSALSSSAVVDPNQPVQKSSITIFRDLLHMVLNTFGAHIKTHKRDLENLPIDLNDPAQKAAWNQIGTTILGSLSKRDVDNLTDDERKSLIYIKHFFGLDGSELSPAAASSISSGSVVKRDTGSSAPDASVSGSASLSAGVDLKDPVQNAILNLLSTAVSGLNIHGLNIAGDLSDYCWRY
ncbi:unnamed protein product [Ambrosiozyma monospora]|uniref:Unnamed protein product n=1 Tax=Ambrosiozyma monospora TaxID=43982 RepID=A0ACB5T0K0_AMBMO|nr:unnamed protein product [Ambrosiozyma monospora]